MNPNDWFHGDASVLPDEMVIFSESGKSLDWLAKDCVRRGVPVRFVTFGFSSADQEVTNVNLRTWATNVTGSENIPEMPFRWAHAVLTWAAAYVDDHGIARTEYLVNHKAPTRG